MNISDSNKDVLRKQLLMTKTKVLQARLQQLADKLKKGPPKCKGKKKEQTTDDDVPKENKRKYLP